MYFLKFEFFDFLLSIQETNHRLKYFESSIKLLILDSCLKKKNKIDVLESAGTISLNPILNRHHLVDFAMYQGEVKLKTENPYPIQHWVGLFTELDT